MQRALVLLSLVPIAVYLDVVKFNAPVFSAVAVLVLPLMLIWAWVRRAKKHPLSKTSLVLSLSFLAVCPMLTLFFASQQEQRIAEQVKTAAATIAQHRTSTGRYPNSLKEVASLAALPVLVSERSLMVGGRLVSYSHGHTTATNAHDQDFAKLSYWSFGAYQRQLFDIGSGAFDSPLTD